MSEQKNTPKHPMTPEDASRIQSDADKHGHNEEFKRRAQSAGDRRANEGGQNAPKGGDKK